MFGRKKRELYIVTLSPAERKLTFTTMMRFRNKLLTLKKVLISYEISTNY